MTQTTEEKALRHLPQGRRGGEWVRLGLDEYQIPPLGFRALQERAADIQALSSIGAAPTMEQMSVVGRIVHAAMQRNYPAITEDEVLDMLDVGNFQRVLGAVLGMSGFQQGGGGDGAGEARASIGVASTSP